MAVIKNLGLSVTIEVNGTPLHEYDDSSPGNISDIEEKCRHVCHKYVEAKDGDVYGIHVKALPRNRWLTELAPDNGVLDIDIYIDGKHQAGTVCSWRHQLTRGGVLISDTRQYHSSHRVSFRKFSFTNLNTVDGADGETVKGDLQRASSLGLIRVVIFRSLQTGVKEAYKRNDATDAGLTVAEQALKGSSISLGTSLSSAVTISSSSKKPNKLAVVERVDDHPYAIFSFKYRSKNALQDEMVIPRTPSPDMSEEGLEGLSLADVRRLARERLADVKKEKRVKSEAPVVKREYDEAFDLTEDRPRKMLRRRAERDTIDLTED